MGKLDKFTETLQSVSDGAAAFSETAGTIAATAGNVVGSFKSGAANPTGRPINDIQVSAEVGDGVKIIAFALIAAFVVVFLKVRKK